MPYRDFAAEYPPLALTFFTLPRLFASTLAAYHTAFALEILAFDLIGIFLILKLSRQLGINSIVTLLIYTAIIIAIGPIIIFRFDLIPAVLTLAAIFAFSDRKYWLAWALLAVAVMTKIYPVVIAPVFLLYHLSRKQYRAVGWGVASFGITLAVIAAAGLILSPSGFWNSFTLQAHRGLHVESVYASFVLVGESLGLTTVDIRTTGPTPLSVDAVSSQATILAQIAPLFIVAILLFIYWRFYRRQQTDTPASGGRTEISGVLNYSFLAVLGFMLTSSVFSPQFLLWLCPLIPLVIGQRWRHTTWIIFIAASIITYYIYPLHYNEFIRGSTSLAWMLFSRNILLLGLLFWLIEWRQSVPLLQSSRFKYLPIGAAAVLVLLMGSVLYAQFGLHINILPGGNTIYRQSDLPAGGQQFNPRINVPANNSQNGTAPFLPQHPNRGN